MNEQLKNQWLPIVKNSKIQEIYYDKVLRYVDMFMIDSALYGASINYDVYNILPLSLDILSKVDLSRIEFINYPMGMQDIVMTVKNKDNIISEVSNFINNKLEEGFDIRIYKVIQDKLQDNDEIRIHSRMKFHKPGESEPNYINNIDGKIFPTEDDTYFK